MHTENTEMTLNMKSKRKRPGHYGIRVTDLDRKTFEFDSAKDAAQAMDVTRQALYMALKYGWYIRGCRIEKTEKPGINSNSETV